MRSPVSAFLFVATNALAHPGHGATELHLHPSEWTWLVLALAVAGAIAWLMRK